MTLRVGIAGGGIGGLSAAITLHRQGHHVTVFEQADKFARVGADINLTPNAVRALDGLGIGDELRRTAARPTHRISRDWDTGEETSRIELSDSAEARYGAPQLTMHRADLMTALEQALPAANVQFSKRATGFDGLDGTVSVSFADGTGHDVDVLIGADGIHSAVRTGLFGAESPEFTGVVAYRAVLPREQLAGVPNLDAFTKWWGPTSDIQIVTFPLNRGRDIFVFATTPQESWTDESWTQPGDADELRASYTGFHPEATALLDPCREVLKSALYVRDPLSAWSRGRVTILGDAAHPMMPFMAQGAGQAIEDGIVLARHLDVSGRSVEDSLARFESARKDRTAKIQVASRGNNWLKESGNADWVYQYDAWSAPVD